jgi:hypothetical protein
MFNKKGIFSFLGNKLVFAVSMMPDYLVLLMLKAALVLCEKVLPLLLGLILCFALGCALFLIKNLNLFFWIPLFLCSGVALLRAVMNLWICIVMS